jgi:hypothetical protein
MLKKLPKIIHPLFDFIKMKERFSSTIKISGYKKWSRSLDNKINQEMANIN